MYKWYIMNVLPGKSQKLISENHEALLAAKDGNERDDVVYSIVEIVVDEDIPSLITEKNNVIHLRERRTQPYFCDYLKSFIRKNNLGAGKINEGYNQVMGSYVHTILQSSLKNYIDAYMTEIRAFEELDEKISQMQEEYGIKLNPKDIPGMDMPSMGSR